MLSFKLRGWNAYTPGLDSSESWDNWLNSPYVLPTDCPKPKLSRIPTMLRRRFTALGKGAVEAADPLLNENEQIPLVFASRHGDVDLTLSLLKSIAANEPLSPTSFSLAVHNAISGLYSIARKDKSEITAISATENLIPFAILEAATQLQEHKHILCIICESTLPDLYKPFASSPPFTYAIAMVLSRDEGDTFNLSRTMSKEVPQHSDNEFKELIALLLSHSQHALFPSTKDSQWSIKR
ncbi:beta-ketoacyl synthase chain length factor [Marinomonas sp. 5E14-1]|uniref:beta-ketoacyl synthase chain length factor n=1 Tax=Marinomonas sp. 5E14-1 TaxID=3153922 RepID=UPI0032633FB9